MIRMAVVGLLAFSLPGMLSGADFPLRFQKLSRTDVMAFPGGNGNYTQLATQKPQNLVKEPAAVSSRPLYGEWQIPGSSGLVFRLDESQGKGKGYDQLLVDWNGNRNLSDDTGWLGGNVNPSVRSSAGQPQFLIFGPMDASAKYEIAGGRPQYYANFYVYPESMSYAGQANLKTGWYLEAEPEFDGAKTRFAIFDGDGNSRLGDLARQQTYKSDEGDQWSIYGGDNFVLDMDGSGKYENRVYPREGCAFGEMVYIGSKPYRVKPASDWKSVSINPWTEELAEVSVEPKGEQVQNVCLARQGAGDSWQVLSVPVEKGKIRVPPGKYRLYTCALIGDRPSGDRILASAYQRTPKKPFEFAVGKPNVLSCGGVLDVKVSTAVRRPEEWETLPGKTNNDSDSVLVISSTISGADGEIYSSYAAGKEFDKMPPKPAVSISSGGKEVAKGNMEFG